MEKPKQYVEKPGRFVEKRAFPRLSINLYAKIYYEMQVIRGTVMNISENGISIKSTERLPVGSDAAVFIPLIRDALDVNIRVVRCIKINDIYYEIAAEILNSPKAYFKFIYDYFDHKDRFLTKLF